MISKRDPYGNIDAIKYTYMPVAFDIWKIKSMPLKSTKVAPRSPLHLLGGLLLLEVGVSTVCEGTANKHEGINTGAESGCAAGVG